MNQKYKNQNVNDKNETKKKTKQNYLFLHLITRIPFFFVRSKLLQMEVKKLTNEQKVKKQ